jgi:hypothetical protein
MKIIQPSGIERRVVSEWADVSYVRSASIIRAMIHRPEDRRSTQL